MNDEPTESTSGHEHLEHQLSIVELALEPALTLARAMSLPLDDLLSITEKAYFRQFQERGLSFTAMAQRLGKSRRTVATLAQKARLDPGERGSDPLTLRRMILQKLSAHGPATAALLRRRFPGQTLPVLNTELETLQSDGMVERVGDRYQVAASSFSLLGEDRERRLASLRQFLQAVTDVVYQRFFALDGRAEAFARVLSFRSSASALKRIGEECYAALREQVLEADAEQDKKDKCGVRDGREVSVALFYSEAPLAPALRR
jgi:hypothetical protein